jgi:hypothetical protein
MIMKAPLEDTYLTKSPILFIIFNRVDTTLQVFEQIKRAKPDRLYITADGPRTTRPLEDLQCAETKAAVLAEIDWECEVKTLFRDKNLGPKEAISSAINWFFENETEGIILEHDCLPSNSFFMFCDTLLEKYRFDTRIWLISGCNLLKGQKWGEASYYFSQLTNGWGWASWRRSWKDYDKELTQYDVIEVKEKLKNIFDDPLIIDCWVHIFNEVKAGKIDTWDYQAGFTHFFNNCINIVPNNNLVSNIGFGAGAENTQNANSIFASIPLEEIGEIKHPKYILPQKEADRLIMLEEFKLNINHLRKHNSRRRRFKRWLKHIVKKPNPIIQ